MTLRPIMEVGHVTYIFGSVSRRRQVEDMTAPSRRSLEPSPAASQQRLTGRYERADTVVARCFILFNDTLPSA